MISAIVITKNEEKNIRNCLQSIQFVDEIIVIDSGSTDKTVSICKEYTEKVFFNEWQGFGPQKQKALELATGDWILSIDADEVVTDDLKSEILAVIKKNNGTSGYYIPRLSYFLGQPIKHCGWYPDFILRLFKRNHGKFSPNKVHEYVIVDGQTERLSSHFLHFSYENLHQVVDKFNTYSSIGADKLVSTNSAGGLAVAIVRAFLAFTKVYIVKLGLLDGRRGFMIAVTSAETAYYKYLKLYFQKTTQKS
jgi:glycosyltransferase involved in cell wall biosynthesis